MEDQKHLISAGNMVPFKKLARVIFGPTFLSLLGAIVNIVPG